MSASPLLNGTKLQYKNAGQRAPKQEPEIPTKRFQKLRVVSVNVVCHSSLRSFLIMKIDN